MGKLGEIWRRLRMLARHDAAARELDEEMRLHREMKERELIAGGEREAEARYAAARAFGNGMSLSERGREAWVGGGSRTWRRIACSRCADCERVRDMR
jgi:hypothetical protein